jgi:ComEC/Rec2-related protein
MFFKHTSHLLLLILGYSLGIIVIYWNFFSFYTGSPLLISLSICTFLLAYFTKTRPYVFLLFCFLATFLMGSLRMEMHPSQRLFKTLHHEGKQKNTLETINPFTLEINGNKPQYYQFVIEAPLKSQGKQYRYVAEISPIKIKDCTVLANNHLKSNPIQTVKALLSHAKDTLKEALKIGQVGLAKGYLNIPSATQLPRGFSYKNYLRTQDIHFTLYISHWKKIDNSGPKSGYKYLAAMENIKRDILEKIKTTAMDSAAIQVYSALVFGEKKTLDPGLRTAYQNAGAAHILAISCLHIGMIAAMLLFILAPLQRLPRGKVLSSVLLIFCLWIYAVFSGSSPSVVRAVAMFGFLSVGWIFNRPMFSLHYLAISFFFMVLWNPLVLFSLGFVMSYAAVASILLGMPLVESLGVPKNTLNSFKNNYGIHEIIHKEWANSYQLEEFKIIFPKTTNHIKGPISHIIIDSSARAYPSHFKPEQLKNTQLITSGFYPTKEMNAWEKWPQKNGRLIWKIDTQGFYSFKKDPAP